MTTGVQTYLCLGQTNVLLLEEELAVEVADIYGVQVNLEGGGSNTKSLRGLNGRWVETHSRQSCDGHLLL